MNEFCIGECAVGFDLDHTLVRYKNEELGPLIFDSLVGYLVNKKGYPKQLLEFGYEEKFVRKGVVFDKHLGNLLLVNDSKQVVKIFHGTKVVYDITQDENLNPEGVEEKNEEDTLLLKNVIYPGPINEFDAKAKEFKARDRFHAFLTRFDTPIISFLARYIDYAEEEEERMSREDLPKHENKKQKTSRHKYDELFADLIESFIYTFSNYHDQQGDYFPAVKKNPKKYVDERNDVKEWIKMLRKKGIPTFLVTNSFYGYANLLLLAVFGEDWNQLFDLTIMDAKKPKFFKNKNPFKTVDLKNEVEEDTLASTLELGGIYCQGNSIQLEEFFHEKFPKSKPLKFLYFGDNLLTDVMAIKLSTPWIPVAVIEEIEQEAQKKNSTRKPDDYLSGTQQQKTENGKIAQKKDEGMAFSPSIFYYNPTNPSYWNKFIRLHSALSVADLESILHIPLDQTFYYDFQKMCSFLPELEN